MNYQDLFIRLWNEYALQNPSAKKIYNLFSYEGETIENDHIAFRTFNDNRINIPVISKAFEKIGYIPKGEYFFEEKKLRAIHLENNIVENSPRVFISELELEKCSAFVQDTINNVLNSMRLEEVKKEEIIFKGNVWGKPEFAIYEKLRNESEYAAWVYVYGFRTNHFTVSINSLKKYNTIEKVNEFLKQKGFILNSSGGEIKGTPEMLLQQSSIMADIIDVEFKEGVHQIPACYYEFALRFPDADGKLYSGFHAKSADKIFESTNFYTKE